MNIKTDVKTDGKCTIQIDIDDPRELEMLLAVVRAGGFSLTLKEARHISSTLGDALQPVLLSVWDSKKNHVLTVQGNISKT